MLRSTVHLALSSGGDEGYWIAEYTEGLAAMHQIVAGGPFLKAKPAQDRMLRADPHIFSSDQAGTHKDQAFSCGDEGVWLVQRSSGQLRGRFGQSCTSAMERLLRAAPRVDSFVLEDIDKFQALSFCGDKGYWTTCTCFCGSMPPSLLAACSKAAGKATK